jgi:hypothetical protein
MHRISHVLAGCVAALCLLAPGAGAQVGETPGVRPNLQREGAVLDSGRDLIAGTIGDVSSPAADGRRTLVLNVTQVFQGTLWRGQHTVHWSPAAPDAAAPGAGVRVIAFVSRAKDGAVHVAGDEIFADNPENRAIAQVRYVRIGRSDRSLEFLLVAAAVAVALVALFALRHRRRLKPQPQPGGPAPR